MGAEISRLRLDWRYWPGRLYDIARAAGVEWTTRGEDWTPSFITLIAQAKHSIHICSSDLLPEFFEQHDVLAQFRGQLINGINIEIILSKLNAVSAEDVAEKIRVENPGLVRLKQEFPKQLRFFSVAPGRPRLQFTIVDSLYTIHLEADYYALSPATIAYYNDKKWARKWDYEFNDVGKSSQEILI